MPCREGAGREERKYKMIKWAYILLGEDVPAKVSFQKEVTQFLSDISYQELNPNQIFDVAPHLCTDNTRKVFIMNEHLQKDGNAFVSVSGFFDNNFKEADACILSSKLLPLNNDVEAMVRELKRRFYNVCGVFFEPSSVNDPMESSGAVAASDYWDERYYIGNHHPVDGKESWQNQLEKHAQEFSRHILGKI